MIRKFAVFLFFVSIFSAFPQSKSGGGGRTMTGGRSLTGGGSLTGGKSMSGGKPLTDGKNLVDGQSLVGENAQSIGVYDVVVERNFTDTASPVQESVYADVNSDVYANGYGKYLKLVTEKGVDARAKFVKYFSDWQWSGQKEDFYAYSQDRAEREKQLERCYDAAFAQFGIGTAIIAATWIVAFVIPGGQIYQAAVIVIAKATTFGALSGAVGGAVSSAGFAYFLEGKRGGDLVYEVVNGAADGYLWGAITGLVSGGVKVYSLTKNAVKIGKSYTIFAGKVYDSSGKLLLDVSKVGKAEVENLAKILQEHGDDALNALSKVSKQNPENLSLAIEWINAKGRNGAHDVIKWNGKIPGWLSKGVITVAKKISESSIKAASDELLKLPGIKLSVAELDKIRQNPALLKEIVGKYTGKSSFRDGYLEFFVRLAKKSPKQVEEIWNYSKAVRDIIKNEGIRPGGVHEWLMCENFCDFLVNPKWRKDGACLCKLLSNLTQPTKSVAMENVGIVLKDGSREFYPTWTHLLESSKTLGSASNPRSVIHNLIRGVVEKSNSCEELVVNLDAMVKENFTKETYAEFSKVLANSMR